MSTVGMAMRMQQKRDYVENAQILANRIDSESVSNSQLVTNQPTDRGRC